MIAYRDGKALTVCDWCFRPRIMDEEGWRMGVVVGRRFRTADEIAVGGEGSLVEHVEDRCPDCAPTGAPSVKGAA